MIAATEPNHWPSLAPHLSLASSLFGERGEGLVRDWLAEHMARIDDPAFAKLFTDHIDLPGIEPADYKHRLVRTERGSLLGGIRFYGQDTTRPFVEVVAHDFGDWNALADAVASEWHPFAPLHLRTLGVHGHPLPPGAHVDMSIHLARYGDMAPPDGRVTLASFGDVEDAVAMVARRYEELGGDDPALARNISAADPDDLRAWHRDGRLVAIHALVDGHRTVVGLFAAAPGSVEWIAGDEVNEEVIAKRYNGRGFAASAQAAWAARDGVDADRLLVGTIDRLNVASRRTAERAGRPPVLDYVFVSLTEPR